MDKQIIVAISREFGSGGKNIARAVAKALDIKLYDRNMLDSIAEEKNIQVEYLEKYDEKPTKLLFSRRVGAYSNSFEEIIADMQFEFLRKCVESGESFVVVGRCAEAVLKGTEGLISIFIMGDKEAKIQSVVKQFKINEQEAKIKMDRHDKKRKQYHNRHSDMKWGDSRNYDLCINSSKLGIEKTAEIIVQYIEERIK